MWINLPENERIRWPCLTWIRRSCPRRREAAINVLQLRPTGVSWLQPGGHNGNPGVITFLMINATVRQQVSGYRSEFANASPFPHLVIDDFFDADKAEQLLTDFPAFDPANARNEFGEVGRKATVPDLRKISPFYAAVYDYIAAQEFLDFIAEVTGIPNLVHDEQMFGGGTHENLEGQDLDPHVDFNFIEERKLHRRLNLLLYLNKEWDASWGGCLEIHSNPRRPKENQIKVVAPVFNRCVIFETSEHSWHGFERIQLPEGKKHLSRKMLSIYLYTRDRPAEQIAPPHGTFYVQRPLPSRLAPGYALTVDDVKQLEELIARRDSWIEFYHRKELADSQRIQDRIGYTRHLEESRGALDWVRALLPKRKKEEPPSAAAPAPRSLQVPLSGYGIQEGPARGIWPDGWIGSPFEVTIRLSMPADSILLEGVLPGQTLPEMELQVSVNDAVVSQEVFRPGDISLNVPAEAGVGELIKLRIVSDRSFCPMRAGAGADRRELVMVLRELRVLRGALAQA